TRSGVETSPRERDRAPQRASLPNRYRASAKSRPGRHAACPPPGAETGKEQAMARRQGGGMTVAEAGRMGGRLVSEKYGPEFYEKIGKKGGSSTASKYGPEFFGRIGKKGGKAVTAKYGPGHFEKIGRKGGQKVADLIERAKSLESGERASAVGGERVDDHDEERAEAEPNRA